MHLHGCISAKVKAVSLCSPSLAYKVLSNKEQRKLYDSVGHQAYLNDASVDTEDEHETSFHFSFADFFDDFDSSPFAEEQHFHWSFHQDWEDEGDTIEHFRFEEPGFSFYFGDGDEDDEDHYF